MSVRQEIVEYVARVRDDTKALGEIERRFQLTTTSGKKLAAVLGQGGIAGQLGDMAEAAVGAAKVLGPVGIAAAAATVAIGALGVGLVKVHGFTTATARGLDDLREKFAGVGSSAAIASLGELADRLEAQDRAVAAARISLAGLFAPVSSGVTDAMSGLAISVRGVADGATTASARIAEMLGPANVTRALSMAAALSPMLAAFRSSAALGAGAGGSPVVGGPDAAMLAQIEADEAARRGQGKAADRILSDQRRAGSSAAAAAARRSEEMRGLGPVSGISDAQASQAAIDAFVAGGGLIGESIVDGMVSLDQQKRFEAAAKETAAAFAEAAAPALGERLRGVLAGAGRAGVGGLGVLSGLQTGGLAGGLSALGPAGGIAGQALGLMQADPSKWINPVIREITRLPEQIMKNLPELIGDGIPRLIEALIVAAPQIFVSLIQGLVIGLGDLLNPFNDGPGRSRAERARERNNGTVMDRDPGDFVRAITGNYFGFGGDEQRRRGKASGGYIPSDGWRYLHEGEQVEPAGRSGSMARGRTEIRVTAADRDGALRQLVRELNRVLGSKGVNVALT